MNQRSFRWFCIIMIGIIAFIGWTNNASAARQDWRWDKCRFRHYEGGMNWTNSEVRMTIQCAVQRWDVPGGLTAAYCIAAHESGYNENNYNPSSGASGVYQFLRSTWSGTVSNQSQIFRRWEMRHSVFNARSNVVAAVRVAHMGSWSPWTTDSLCGVA